MKSIARVLLAAGPLTVLVLPKCPLCIMPLLALTGVAIPAGPLLNAVSAALVAGFTLLLLPRTSPAVRALAIAGAALLIAGRVVPLGAATWTGAAAMIAVAVLRARCTRRGCTRATA